MPTDSGSIGYEIIAMQRACEQQTPYLRPDCPVCSWPLETTTDQIRHCRFCGYTEQNVIKRDVQRP